MIDGRAAIDHGRFKRRTARRGAPFDGSRQAQARAAGDPRGRASAGGRAV